MAKKTNDVTTNLSALGLFSDQDMYNGKTLEEIEALANLACTINNEAYAELDFHKGVASLECANAACAAYAELARVECFKGIMDSEDPMFTAIVQATYDVIAVKDEREPGVKRPKKVIGEKSVDIDLLQVNAFCKNNGMLGGIGKDKTWEASIQFVNRYLTAEVSDKLGLGKANVLGTFAMSKEAMNVQGLTGDITADIQTILNKMLGEELVGGKVKACDTAFLNYAHTTRSGMRNIKCNTHSKLCTAIRDIAYGIIKDVPYTVTFKQKRK